MLLVWKLQQNKHKLCFRTSRRRRRLSEHQARQLSVVLRASAKVALYQTVPMMVYVDCRAVERDILVLVWFVHHRQEELWRDANPEESSK